MLKNQHSANSHQDSTHVGQVGDQQGKKMHSKSADSQLNDLNKNSPPSESVQPDTSRNAKSSGSIDSSELSAELQSCRLQLKQALEEKQRALADYKNLERRTQEDRSQMARLATRALASDLLEHFDHLSMAAEHAKDPALSMIVEQLWQTLNNHGLVEIKSLGETFDPRSMEAVSASGQEDESSQQEITSATVTKVIQRGYSLHGVVLRPAKVML